MLAFLLVLAGVGAVLALMAGDNPLAGAVQGIRSGCGCLLLLLATPLVLMLGYWIAGGDLSAF